MTLKVSFEVGSNLDMDNVLTQNRVSQAMPQMPQSVKNYGVSVKKALAFPLLVISIKSPNGHLRQQLPVELHDDQHQRRDRAHPGRRPDQPVRRQRLRDARLAAARSDRPARPDRAGHRQRDHAAEPAEPGRPDRRTAGGVRAPSTPTPSARRAGCSTKSEFGDIILRTNPDGSQVRLKDVARLELGTMLYNAVGRHDGKPAAVIAVFQIPGHQRARRRRTASRRRWRTCRRGFRATWSYLVSLDTTLPVSEGINEIVHTLFEAVVLVIIVVFVFLQNWRATLIPLMTVPVSLVGAFIFFPMLGFSINVLSLLGLVLAIGIVVDDAIVVVEAVMHHIEHGMAPKEATIKAMEEVSGPVIAIGLILSAVFVPVGFMGGITGRLYQQFAITIALSVLLSVVNALTLSPALAALLLKAPTGKKTLLTPFYNGFNKVFGWTTDVLRELRRHPDPQDVPQPGVHGRAAVPDRRQLVRHIPGGFVPEEDQGYMLVNALLPDAASLERTDAVMKKAEAVLEKNEAVEGFNTITRLQPAHRRVLVEHGLLLRAAEAVGRAARPGRDARQRRHRGAQSRLRAADSGGGGRRVRSAGHSRPRHRRRLHDASCRIAAAARRSTWRSRREVHAEAARKRPEIGRIGTLYRASVPQIYRRHRSQQGAQVRRAAERRQHHARRAARQLVRQRLQPVRPRLQGLRPGRAGVPAGSAASSGCSTCERAGRRMVPLDTLRARRGRRTGPEFTNRFNLFRTAELTGVPAPGFSSTQALDALEETARDGAAAGHEPRLGGHVVPGAQGARASPSCSRSPCSSCS